MQDHQHAIKRLIQFLLTIRFAVSFHRAGCGFAVPAVPHGGTRDQGFGPALFSTDGQRFSVLDTTASISLPKLSGLAAKAGSAFGASR